MSGFYDGHYKPKPPAPANPAKPQYATGRQGSQQEDRVAQDLALCRASDWCIRGKDHDGACMRPVSGTCGIAGCTGNHQPGEHNAAVEQEQRERKAALGAVPGWCEEHMAGPRMAPQGCPDCTIAALRGEVVLLADHVMQIGAERDAWKNGNNDLHRENQALRVERDELIHKLDLSIKSCDSYFGFLHAAEAERDRYREALGQITAVNHTSRCYHIARAALTDQEQDR